MSNNLKEAVDSCIITLRELDNDLQRFLPSIRGSTKSRVPTEIYERWEKRAALHQNLSASLPLISARDSSFALLRSIKAEIDKMGTVSAETELDHLGLKVPACFARTLSLTAYLMTTWSLYDRLSNVAGRLVGGRNQVNETRSYFQTKLPDYFVPQTGKGETGGKSQSCGRKDPYDGFSLHEVIEESYVWHVHCSYQLRNIFAHDGGLVKDEAILDETNSASLFLFSQSGADSFNKYLQERLQHNDAQNKPILPVSFRAVGDRENVIDLLCEVNDAIDDLFISLLHWGCKSFNTQVCVFAMHDKFRAP